MRTLEGIDTCPVAWLDIWAIQLEDMRTLEGIDTIDISMLAVRLTVRRYENP